LGRTFSDVKAAADHLYSELLAAGVGLILMTASVPSMFADWELIGARTGHCGDRLKEGIWWSTNTVVMRHHPGSSGRNLASIQSPSR
jgi:hypothetical protein